MNIQKITPFLWYDNRAEEAATFYTGIFPNSNVIQVTPMVVTFSLDGQRLMAINGGPMFKFTEAVSFLVDCADQKEVDYFWDKLIADGGSESRCGWLKDKFDLSWQIVPKQLMELMSSPDKEAAGRAMQAMMGMKKIVIADLEKAFHQK
ncbi:MAG: VOC family protein [Bacteroidia bacterium]